MRGYGEPRTIGLPNAAGNVAVNLTVPAPVTYDVRAVSFLLLNAAGGAARRPVVTLVDGVGVPVAQLAAPFTLGAGLASRFTFGPDVMQFGANDAAQIGGPLPRIRLTMGMRVRVSVGNGAAGDSLSDVRVSVVQYAAEHDAAPSEE